MHTTRTKVAKRRKTRPILAKPEPPPSLFGGPLSDRLRSSFACSQEAGHGLSRLSFDMHPLPGRGSRRAHLGPHPLPSPPSQMHAPYGLAFLFASPAFISPPSILVYCYYGVISADEAMPAAKRGLLIGGEKREQRLLSGVQVLCAGIAFRASCSC